MDLAVTTRRRAALGPARHPGAVAAAQIVGPGGICGGLAVARRFHHRRQRQIRARQQFRRATSVVQQFARIVGDPDEPRIREHRRRAIAELVVQLAADHQHRIRLGHRCGPHGADH